MTPQEFISEAKARGLPKEQVQVQYEKLQKAGKFSEGASYSKGFTDQPVAGVFEVAAREATGAVSALGGGLAYLGTLIASGGDTEGAGAVFENITKEGTYEPRTQAGKQAGEVVDAPFIWAGEQLDKAAIPLAEAGYPGLATGVKVGGGAVAMLASAAAGKKIATTGARKLVVEPLNKAQQKHAQGLITQVEDVYKRHHDNLGDPKAAWDRTLSELNIDSPESMVSIIDRAGAKPKIDFRKKEPVKDADINTPTNTPESLESTQNIVGRAVNYIDETIGKPSETVSKLAQGIDLRIKKFSNDIYLALNKLELETGKLVNDRIVEIQGFSKAYNRLSQKHQYDLDILMANGIKMNTSDYKKSIQDFTNDLKNGKDIYHEIFREGGVRDILDEMYRTDVKQSGHKTKKGEYIKELPNYIPTLYKNEKSLLKKIGDKESGIIANKMEKARKEKGDELTSDERTRIIADVISSGKFQGGMNIARPGHLKGRYSEMNASNVKEYARTPEALQNYIREVTTNSKRRQMLGLGDDNTLDTSIGRYLDDLYNNGKLSHQDRAEVEALLKVRFSSGEKLADRWLQNAKNIMYMFTIGHLKSAITQAGDIYLGAAVNGLGPTFKSLVMRQSGRVDHKNRARVVDLGLTRAGQELETLVGTTRLLNWFLNKTGFNWMDRLGKQSIMDGAYVKAQDMLKENPTKFNETYRKQFQTDQELNSFKDALSKGLDNQETMQLQINTITRLQPATRSQMSQKYLEMPNGRVFFQLKTFTLKQLNFAYDEGIRKMGSKNPKEVMEGARMVTAWSTLMVLSGMSTDAIKDLIFNGGELRDLDDSLVNNMLKIIGLSKYDTRDLGREPVNTFLQSWFMPPVSVFNPFILMEVDKAIKRLPIAGDVYDLFDEPSKRD